MNLTYKKKPSLEVGLARKRIKRREGAAGQRAGVWFEKKPTEPPTQVDLMTGKDSRRRHARTSKKAVGAMQRGATSRKKGQVR